MVEVMVKKKIEVEQFNQEDEGFWNWMGRHFASAQIKRELGIPMSSDETYQWFLAFSGKDLAGFCAVTPERSGSRLRHVYVLPEFRNSGTGKQLIAAAITSVKKPLVVTVKADDASFYTKFEFKPNGKAKGQYIDMIKE